MVQLGATSYSATTGQIAGLSANVGTVTSIATASPITGGTITTTGTIGLQSASIDNTYLAPMPASTGVMAWLLLTSLLAPTAKWSLL